MSSRSDLLCLRRNPNQRSRSHALNPSRRGKRDRANLLKLPPQFSRQSTHPLIIKCFRQEMPLLPLKHPNIRVLSCQIPRIKRLSLHHLPDPRRKRFQPRKGLLDPTISYSGPKYRKPTALSHPPERQSHTQPMPAHPKHPRAPASSHFQTSPHRAETSSPSAPRHSPKRHPASSTENPHYRPAASADIPPET